MLLGAASVVGLNAERLSDEQFYQLGKDCLNNQNKVSCQRLIDNGLESVEQCNKKTCVNYGGIYDFAGNYQQAIKYYQRAAELGDTRGYHNLAFLYQNGIGVKQNFFEAVKLYQKACDLNYAEACNNLGILYGNGQGVQKNPSTAKTFFGKACDLGNQLGCDNYRKIIIF